MPLDFQPGSSAPEIRGADGSQESESCDGKEACGIRMGHSNLAARTACWCQEYEHHTLSLPSTPVSSLPRSQNTELGGAFGARQL